MNKNQYVDVFLGCDGIDLPKPEGIAAQWHFIKGLAGNTTPAAARPFSKMTACAYSGGYSAGYANIGVNSGETLRRIMPENTIRGFSHIHHSGTGYIDTFYNYAIVAPFFNHPHDAFEPEIMEAENAHPGYYSAKMRGVLCELTVSAQAAHHRYTFDEAGGKLAIDFTNDGLLEEKTRMAHQDLKVRIVREDLVECEVTLHNLKLYFAVCCPGAKAQVWEKGCVFDVQEAKTVRLALGLSPKSMEIARGGALEATQDFDAIARDAADKWNEMLSAIEIEADDERDVRLFYSNFYHTLIKPSDWHGESFIYEDEEACTLDFATLWDQYKTQFPLLFTLYPQMTDRIVRTIMAYCGVKKRMPHILLLERSPEHEAYDSQARMLAEHALLDAHYRGAQLDKKKLAACIRDDVLSPERFTDYKETGRCKNLSQTIDMADGCHASAELARLAGDEQAAEACDELAKKWVAAFDPQTGLLRTDSWYYEGNHWNYSFRLMHDMDTRLALAGGKEAYAKLLDRFFGFECEAGELAYFEGFNNETDMETPYAYHYADRHDRLSEVVRGGVDYMFCEGRGGIPGNNDSGGLSSLYMWNVMGFFPVSGQDLMIIGSPKLKAATMHLASGKTFTMRREGSGIYVRSASLNGRKLERLEFTASEMMRGGELVITMAAEP